MTDTRTNKINRIYEAEANLVMEQSEIHLQKRNDGAGLNGELKTSGWLVENYVKSLISKHVPSGYRVS